MSNLLNVFDIVLSYFNANFEQISHIVLVFPLLNLNKLIADWVNDAIGRRSGVSIINSCSRQIVWSV